MKPKIITVLLCTIALFFSVSCSNKDWEFPDFNYTTCYFPWQFPVRTLVLGEVDYDNTNDKAHQFVISATIGGVYANAKDRLVNFEQANDLIQNLTFEDGRGVKILPSSYYTFLDSKIIVPKGSISGGVKIQLSDAFFNDTLSYSTNYVIPLRITSAETDSILIGEPNISNPDPRIAGDWKKVPKNYTLFGIKYVNKYHGNYLLRGKTTITKIATSEVNEVIYHNALIEKNIVSLLSTRGLGELAYTRPMATPPGVSGLGSYIARIKIDADGNCLISEDKNSTYPLTGSGKYAAKAESWGDKSRDVFYLQMNLSADGYNYVINDTLVFRDNTVKFEQFIPVVK